LSSEAPTAAQTISMYPNPVDNLLNIQIKNTQSQQAALKVFDISGRMVATAESRIQNKKIKFNLLYDNSKSLQKKIKLEQLRKETS
jgi:peroxiredoxin